MKLDEIFKPHHISWFEMSLDLDFSFLKSLLENLEDGLERSATQFDQDVEKATAKMTEDDKREYLDYASDEYWTLSDVHPQMTRQSLLIAIYSTTEHLLGYLCRCAHDDRKSNRKPGKRNFYVGKAQQFITSHLSVPVTAFPSEWDQLDMFRLVRNACTHNASFVANDRDGKKIKAYIGTNKTSGLSLDNSNNVRMTREYVEGFLEFAEQFMRKLAGAIDKLPNVK